MIHEAALGLIATAAVPPFAPDFIYFSGLLFQIVASFLFFSTERFP